MDAPPPQGSKRRREDAAAVSATASPPVSRVPFVLRTLPGGGAAATDARRILVNLVFPGEPAKAERYLRPSARDLPGPLAVTVSRRHLPLIRREEYAACEKSDGERFMLLALGSAAGALPRGAYLVSRAFEVCTFDGAAEYAALCCPGGGTTLLDGELIQRGNDAGSGTRALAVYNVFDAVTVDGDAVGSRDLHARIDAMHRRVRNPCRAADEARAAAGAPGLPLLVLTKVFDKVTHVGNVLSLISSCGGGGGAAAGGGGGAAVTLTAPLESEMGAAPPPHRVYRNGARVNGTDGVVFTPVRAPYRALFDSGDPACARPLLKYKFLDEHTVDFLLRREDLEKAAGAGGGPAAEHSVPLHLVTGPSHTAAVAFAPLSGAACEAYAQLADRVARAAAAAAQAREFDGLVVEAAFDPATAAWGIRRVRDRKTKANFIRTGWQTLEVLAEGLTAEQLISELAKPTAAAGAGAGPAPAPSRAAGVAAGGSVPAK